MSQQLRIAAVALGAIAICWFVWKAIDFEAAPAAEVPGNERNSGPGASESDLEHHPSDVSLAADARESLASPVLVHASTAEVAEPPSGPKIRLFGFLSDERTHEPLSDASLHLVDSGWEERTAHSGHSGEYAFEDLEPGTWELTVESLAHRTLLQAVDLVPDELEHRLDLGLAPGEIVKVRLVGSAGLDLLWLSWRSRKGTGDQGAGLEPVVTLSEPSGWLSSNGDAREAEVGKFFRRIEPRFRRERSDPARSEVEPLRFPDGSTVDDLRPEYCGAFALSKPPPVFASLLLDGLVLQTRAVPAGADEVTFELTKEDVEKLAAEVRLRVVDGDTESPPRWVSILLGQRLAGRRGTRIESDGTVLFEESLPGTALLTITADDREIVTEQVMIQPGTTTDLGLYRLRPLSLIRAKVLGDAGEPAQVSFNVFPADRYELTREPLGKRFFRSNVEGALKIDSVGRCRYLILANDEGWVSVPALADTTLGDQEDLEIRVSKGTPVAVRLRADPLPDARLEIRTRTGLPVSERRCRNRDPMKFVLVPGTYSIELWDGETWLASETLAVGTEPMRLYFPR